MNRIKVENDLLEFFFFSSYYILDEIVKLNIPSEQYINRVKQENLILKYYLHSQVKETNQTFTHDDNIIFNKNDIIKPVSQFSIIKSNFPSFLLSDS